MQSVFASSSVLATANSIEDIPEPVRDRFVVLKVNDPTPADLEVMARQL
jgi:ATP-dependent Lon protease